MQIASAGIHLHVTDTGVGETALLFQHFWGGSSRTWNEVISRLRDGFRCIAIDARGAGDSDAPPTGYSTRDHAGDARSVINALGLTRFILIGHSMGGKSSQVLASQCPPGLRGLVLVASSPPSPMAIGEAQREQMRSAYRDRQAVEWTLDHVLMGSPVSASAREELIQDALRVSPEATTGWIDRGSHEDFDSQVAAVTVPVSILAGELDRVDPVSVVKTHLLPCYPSATWQVLPGKGHLLPVEAPDDVAACIRVLDARAP